MRSTMAATAPIAFALALVTAVALAYFVLPGPLAALVTEQFGMEPVELVRSLMRT